MAELTPVTDPIKILEDFLDDKEIDIKALISNENIFKVTIKYYNHTQAVNASAAKMIIACQELLYRIGALLKYNAKDLRKLKKEEKELLEKELEIAFRVTEGSTSLESITAEQVQALMELLPEEYRWPALATVLICITGIKGLRGLYKFYEKYKDTENLKISYQHEETMKELEIEQESQRFQHEERMLELENFQYGQGRLFSAQEDEKQEQIVSLAIEKIAKANLNLLHITNEFDKTIVSCLAEIDCKNGNVEYQGIGYKQKELITIKNKFVSLSKSESESKNVAAKLDNKDTRTIAGEYWVSRIDIGNSSIKIKKSKSEDFVVSYGNDLVAIMRGFNESFKEAIDKKGKLFHITAINVNGQYILQDIHETL